MSQQDLDDADVHAPLQHVRGEAVAERVRPEFVRKAARVSRLVEGVERCVGQVGDDSATRENHFGLRWIFHTSRSMSRIDSVKGRARSLFRLPMTRSTICFESTAVTGSVTASAIRSP